MNILQYTTSTSGTITSQDTQQDLHIMHDAGVTASLTITLPATPFNGQEVKITSVNGISSLTLTTGVGTIANNLTSLSVGESIIYKYLSNQTKWYLITSISDIIVPRSNLLAEYRFDEGSGTTLTDYSGNGNNGTYVGSPTFISGGGFTASGSSSPVQYATGHANFILTAQTIYLVYSPDADSASTNHPIMGNSGGNTYLQIDQSDNTNNSQFPSAHLYGGTGSGSSGKCYSNDTIPLSPAIVAVTIDTNNAIQSQIFIEGKEVLSYNSRALNIALGRGGTPWFGGNNIGNSFGTFNGNIYYAASYSTFHTASQVLQITNTIRQLLNNRGTVKQDVYQPSTLTGQLLALGDSITCINGVGGVTPYLNSISTRITFNKYIKGWPGNSSQLVYAAPGLSSLYYAPAGSYNIVSIFLGTNIISNQSLYEACFEGIKSIAKEFKRKGWQVLVFTIPDRTNTYSYMASYNGLLRSSFTRDEIVDIAADPRLGTSGASTNLTYFQADQVHPTNTSQLLIADYLSAKINRITNFSIDNKTLYSQINTSTVTNTTTETSIVGTSSVNDVEFNNSVFLCNTTNGNNVLSGPFSTSQLVVGQLITGAGIPTNTTISSITDNNHLVMSNNASSSNSNTATTFSYIAMKRHFFVPGQIIVFEQKGLLTTGVSQTLNRKVKIGTTVLGSTGIVTLPSSLTSALYKMNLVVTCVTIGTSGTFQVQGDLSVYNGSNGYSIYPISNTSVVTLDTTIDSIIDITDIWGSASASNIDTSTNLNIIKL
jgi:hypothetical protein